MSSSKSLGGGDSQILPHALIPKSLGRFFFVFVKLSHETSRIVFFKRRATQEMKRGLPSDSGLT